MMEKIVLYNNLHENKHLSRVLGVSLVLKTFANLTVDLRFLIISSVVVSPELLSLARNFLAVPDPDVDVGWNDESEGVAHGFQVQRLNVEDVLEAVRLVGSDISFKCLFCAQIQEIVLLNQFLQLENKINQACL